VIANSHFVGRAVRDLFKCTRTEVIHYPVSSAREQAGALSRSEIRRELGADGPAVVIIQVSRMEAWKGHMLHLEALARLREIPGWVCWMVGGAQKPDEDVYLSRLRRHTAEIGIADRVFFLGQRADVSSLLAAADIFCQPNQFPEPFGIVFVEALSAGLPVVSTAFGGAAEIVDHSCGRLVAPNDPSALAAALRECIENSDLRLQMSINGPARAYELCDPATQLRRLYCAFSAAQTTARADFANSVIHS
jgi:glycosyltransferase involved in cell wall biosynthesis